MRVADECLCTLDPDSMGMKLMVPCSPREKSEFYEGLSSTRPLLDCRVCGGRQSPPEETAELVSNKDN